jgi:hypothetical protein
MPAAKFQDVPSDVLDVAIAAEEHFKLQGYKVQPERRELAFPRVPTLVCKRGHETLVVEVASKLRPERYVDWVGYCKSCTSDTRFAVVVRRDPGLDQRGIDFATQNRVGVFTHNGGTVQIFPPIDLAINVQLPELANMSVKLRRIVAPVYNRFHADWRDGLEAACVALETEARSYLKQGTRSGRIQIVGKNGTLSTLSTAKIDKLTLGQLAGTFRNIAVKNKDDSIIESTLPQINPERIGLAHHRKSRPAERRLRAKAGNHMWSIVNCLKILVP